MSDASPPGPQQQRAPNPLAPEPAPRDARSGFGPEWDFRLPTEAGEAQTPPGGAAAPRASAALTEIVRPLVLAAAAMLGVGLVAPCMTLLTSFGRYDGWVRLLAPEIAREQQSTYSLLGGILAIMEHGNVALGLLLLAFSCVFPTLKLMLMAWANEALAQGRSAGRLFRLAHHTGKFSMLDVMVLALLVIAIKGLPGSSELRLEWGVWAFACSVVLSLVISLLLHRMESRGGSAKRLVVTSQD